MDEDAAIRWAEQEWAVLPDQERHRQISEGFARVNDLRGRMFKKSQYRAALDNLSMKVGAEPIAHAKALARGAARLLREGRIEDDAVVERIRDEESSIPIFIAIFMKAQETLVDAYSGRRLSEEDFVFGLWFVYSRVATFISEFWEKEGWTDDFGPALAAYQQAQVDVAISEPSRRLLP